MTSLTVRLRGIVLFATLSSSSLIFKLNLWVVAEKLFGYVSVVLHYRLLFGSKLLFRFVEAIASAHGISHQLCVLLRFWLLWNGNLLVRELVKWRSVGHLAIRLHILLFLLYFLELVVLQLVNIFEEVQGLIRLGVLRLELAELLELAFG